MKKTLILILAIALMSSVFAYGDVSQVYRQGFVEGYLMEPLGETLKIESYEGNIYSLPLRLNTIYTIDAQYVNASNFIPGMEIYAEVHGRSVTLVEGYSTSSLGYIPPGSKIRTGRVAKIDNNVLVLKLATGNEETFFLTPATVTLKNGVNTSLSALYEGDKVKLYFDEVNANIVSRIHIEGDSIRINGLYKGKVGVVDGFANKITINDVQVLKNGSWSKSNSAALTIPYNGNVPLYIGGYNIPYDNLKYYKGKTMYIAMKDFFGSNQADRMIVQNQYESTYSDKIKDINWFTGEFELKNNRNIGFHDGTIVIKNDRIVDNFSLSSDSDVFVVADGRGLQSSADVIYVLNENVNNSNIGQHYIYAGRMDQIVEDRLWLKNFFLLEENDWQSFDDEKELFFDNDTDIYDLTNNKKLSLKEFYSGSYAVDEDSKYAKDNRLRDWHSYVYTDGDRISAIMVQKNMDSLLRQRVTNGVIAPGPNSIRQDRYAGWTIELTNARDWSSAKAQWMEKNANLNINLEKALIIKDGKQIQPYDLKAGDRIYLVRDDFYGKVLIVK
ncbi:hypothetical protein [Alkaliphilus oremlandii]|uniref:Uncharacterized protein n=1 Tax=Alkaliphilus oremlandii (strain OhILAs) TaxID=350688 RepID=A8MK02_ALKOO|nr:hypothetical protein [Alkaliphilus oremlandii]ABW20134.1 hypothetical protein Clos_2603 [Alkaliphilus oremlandii OhILAs]